MSVLPDRPDLNQLRIQVKEFKHAFEQGEQSAIDRILESHPKFTGRRAERLEGWKLSLRDAQVTIARELGFESWRALLTEVEGKPSQRWESDRSSDISSRAFAEAKKQRHQWCSTDHFLLALLSPPQPTPSSEVLNDLGLTYQTVSDRVAKMDRKQKGWKGTVSTPAYHLILGWAQGIAIGLGTADFTDEHVLLAIVYGDLGGESQLVWYDIDPDEVVIGLRSRGIAIPILAPPVAPVPFGPWGPWVYFPKAEFSAVTRELAKRHPPGTVHWGTNSSKWKKDYWYVHGEDEIAMEEIVRSAVKDKDLIEVLPNEEAIELEKASAPRRYRPRPPAVG